MSCFHQRGCGSGYWKRNVSHLSGHWLLEARRFVSSATIMYILWAWKRDISLLVAHWLLEAKRFASFCPLTVGRLFAYFALIMYIYCGRGSETFRIFRPNNVATLWAWKRDVSLLVVHLIAWENHTNSGTQNKYMEIIE